MKKYISFLLFFSYLLLHSQPFNKRYISDYLAMTFGGIIQTGNHYTLTGIAAKADSTYGYLIKGLFMRTDLQGNVEVQKEYGLPNRNFETWFDANLLSNGDIVVTGYTGPDSITMGKSLIVKYDSIGNLKWWKEYPEIELPTFNFSRIMNTMELPDKSLLCVGYRGKYSMTDYDILGQIIVMKIDSNGNFLGKKLLSTPDTTCPYEHFAWGFLAHPNGQEYIIGAGKQIQGIDSTLESYFIKINGNGTILAEWRLPDSIGNARDIIFTGDNKCVFVTGGRNNGIATADIVKNDPYTHQTIWHTSIPILGPRGYCTFESLGEVWDGSIIACGQDRTIVSGRPIPLQSGWIVKVNSAGQIMWQRKYRGIETDDVRHGLYDMKVDYFTGESILCGESTDFSAACITQCQQGWLLKLDPYGCLVPGCQNVGIVSPTETKQVLSLYPNPTADMLYIYFHDAVAQNGEYSFVIRDLQGKEIVPKTALSNSTTYLFSTHSLAQGMYALELFKGGEFVEVQKFVKE